MSEQPMYELIMQKTLDGSELWLTRILIISTKQDCLDKLKKTLKSIDYAFSLLDLSIEIKGLQLAGNDVLEQRLFVLHGTELETHSIFTVKPYTK